MSPFLVAKMQRKPPAIERINQQNAFRFFQKYLTIEGKQLVLKMISECYRKNHKNDESKSSL